LDKDHRPGSGISPQSRELFSTMNCKQLPGSLLTLVFATPPWSLSASTRAQPDYLCVSVPGGTGRGDVGSYSVATEAPTGNGAFITAKPDTGPNWAEASRSGHRAASAFSS